MARKKNIGRDDTAVYLTDELRARVERVRVEINRASRGLIIDAGGGITRSVVIRMALIKGIEALEDELFKDTK